MTITQLLFNPFVLVILCIVAAVALLMLLADWLSNSRD